MKNLNFSKQIKARMDELDLTGKELSERTGISRSMISQYLHGYTEPQGERRELLVKELGITETPDEVIPKQRRGYGSIAPSECAEIMGKSNTFIYEGLKSKRFNFGYAVKMPSGKWSYWISRKKFFEETGLEDKSLGKQESQ